MKIFNRAFAMLLPAALLATASFSTLALADSQEYALDPGHTQVRISWDHLGFSRPGASFDVTEGLLVWNDEDPSQSSVKVTLAAGSAHTQVDELDEMFRDDYFKVSEYPEITFESTAVKQRGDSNRFEIEGELNIVGQTHPVTLEATLNQAGEHPCCRRRQLALMPQPPLSAQNTAWMLLCPTSATRWKLPLPLRRLSLLRWPLPLKKVEVRASLS